MPTLNEDLLGFSCLRCGGHVPVDDYPEGCPSCWAEGTPSNLRARYGRVPPGGAALPYSDYASLGEGNTDLIPYDAFGPAGPLVFFKAEFQNPTGSHKDRCSALAVARALETGCRTIVCASSGNAAYSVATYGRAAGLAVEVAVARKPRPGFKRALQALGAQVFEFEKILLGWDWMHERGRADDVFIATNSVKPAVGTTPFGIEGYKGMGAELFAQLGPAGCDWLVIPTARGDLLHGTLMGYLEAGGAKPGPKPVAVEPFPRLAPVLAGTADYRDEFEGNAKGRESVSGTTVTWQAVRALTESGGIALTVSEEQAQACQAALAQDGLCVEGTSAMSLAAIRTLVEAGIARPSDRIVGILTAADRSHWLA